MEYQTDTGICWFVMFNLFLVCTRRFDPLGNILELSPRKYRGIETFGAFHCILCLTDRQINAFKH